MVGGRERLVMELRRYMGVLRRRILLIVVTEWPVEQC
jgi:hypothetical protein